MSKLKELRTRYGFKQKDIADKLGTTQQTIARWETGQTAIPAAQLKDLALLLDCSVDELLGMEPRAEERPRAPFATAEHGVPFGAARFSFGFGERFYPIDENIKAALLKRTIGNAGSNKNSWFVFSALNNKLVLLNPETVRQYVIISDDVDEMPIFYHPEVYRALESGETDLGSELAQQIERLRVDLGPSEAELSVSSIEIVYRDGTVDRTFLNSEVADGVFNIVWDADDVPKNSFAVLEAEGSELRKLVNLDHVAAVEVPLERYSRLLQARA